MPTERERRFVGPRRGQLLFALAFAGYAALLLALIADQTVWAEKARLVAQPRFWPAVALVGMAVFGALHLWRLPWRRLTRYDWWEARKWVVVFEFAGWFMAYVLLVPWLGYLPVTMAFVPALCWRMGYRSRSMLTAGLIFAVVVVVLFKGFLSVKIPGGAVYEYLPGQIRSFAILYL